MAHAGVLPRLHPQPLFQSLVVSEPPRTAGRKGLIFSGSVVLHAALIVAIVVLPLVFYDAVPQASERALRAFFASPTEIAPAPPPPPPPAPVVAAARSRPLAVEAPRPVEATAFLAPIEVPDRIVPEAQDFAAPEGGVPGGVEGGVPGGVVGGVVGGLSREIKVAEPVQVVRVGGLIAAPKRVHNVNPEYPEVARLARVSATVILEALVGVDGRVETVKVLSGNPLLDQAAIDAVSQWRYRPLLLNGVPTRFMLTVTVRFAVQDVAR